MKQDIIQHILKDIDGKQISINAGDLFLIMLAYTSQAVNEDEYDEYVQVNAMITLGNALASLIKRPEMTKKQIEVVRDLYASALEAYEADNDKFKKHIRKKRADKIQELVDEILDHINKQ